MEYQAKIKFLYKVYEILNKNLFDGKLTIGKIDIENLDEAYAKFSVKEWILPDGEYTDIECISFSHEFVQRVSEEKYQKVQHYLIVMIMLHEMVHQYCYENGINDEDHNENFQKIAEKHGYRYKYCKNRLMEERLTDLAWLAARTVL